MDFIRKISDVHIDFDLPRQYTPVQLRQYAWMPPALPTDLNTTLIIAGDLWTDMRFLLNRNDNNMSWLACVASGFKYVVFVLGNHDYWGRNLNLEPDKVRAEIQWQGLTNVHLLHNTPVVLDQVKFVGGTLWTDMNRLNPTVVSIASSVMVPDYKFIRAHARYRTVRPDDFYQDHMATKKALFENAFKDDPAQIVVAVTHMAPSEQSVDPKYASQHLENHFYYSNLEARILAEGQDIKWWFHGHMHNPVRYFIGNVEVICNPRGYSSHERTGYDPLLLLPV